MRNVLISSKLLVQLCGACTAALALTSVQAQPFQAHPSTQDEAVKVTLETLAGWEQCRWVRRLPCNTS